MLSVQTGLLPGLLGSVVIAVVTAGLFLFACSAGLRLTRVLAHRSIFAGSLLNGPGHRYSEALERDRSRLRLLLATLGLVPIVFGAVFVAWPAEVFEGLRGPVGWATGIVALLVPAGLTYRIVRLAASRRVHHYALAADRATSEALRRVERRDYWVFHDVVLEDDHLDKVIVGRTGVYALRLFIQPRGRADIRSEEAASLDAEALRFPDGAALPVVDEARARASRASTVFSDIVGKEIPVCPVAVVPGWRLTFEVQPPIPVVNENNLDMFVAWNGPECYLLREEQQAIVDFLDDACRDRRYCNAA